MKPNIWRLFSLLVICSMVLSLAGITAVPQSVAAAPVDNGKGWQPELATAVEAVGYNPTPRGETGAGIYLVRLADAPLSSYRGGISGLAATSPAMTGARGLDLNSPAAIAYTNYLAGKRAEFLKLAQQTVGRQLKVAYEYYAANNGLAVTLTPEEAAKIAALPGVIFVQRDFERELHTDNGPTWIGAPTLWDGTNDPNSVGTMGEGVVIGVIDTGINYSNPSFAAVGPVDSYAHINPLGAGNFLGDCAPGGSYTTYCNDKLIGVHGYATVNDGNPVDYDGHGSHTASTAAGNFVTATLVAPTTTITRSISGVAPHANIIAYGACCTASALTAAIDDIVTDYAAILAVDPDALMTVNYSIGSPAPSDVWNDFDSVGYLNAREAGIFVATSAGNEGPGDETVGSPADAPWLTSVGSLTHDRRFVNEVEDMSGGNTTPPDDMEGAGITAGYGPAPIVYAGNYTSTIANDALCLNPFPTGTFSGQIVVCDRGTNARVDKGANVLAGGAGGMVLADDGIGIVSDPHYLPAVHISQADGVTLKAWLASGSGHQATISGFYLDVADANGDIMAGSSSRGANRALPEIIVPSVAAPGVSILAAYGTNNDIEWNAISGTSMASPHVAGAAALIMALHPDWTPAEVQSAIMTTAWQDVVKEDGVTPADPFAMGSGRVDLTKAAKAGLVLDETIANYWAADPSDGGDPKTLNLASMGNGECLNNCDWERTLRSTVDDTVTWTVTVQAPTDLDLAVTPTSFTLDADGETQVIAVAADVSALPNDVWVFGEVILTPSDASIPAMHLPVAVRPTSGLLPDVVTINTHRNAGSQLVAGLQTAEIVTLTVENFGLAQMAYTNFTLNKMATSTDFPDIFYANLPDDAYTAWINVPAGAMRLVVEVLDTTSPDLDMLVAYDANGNNVMDLADTTLHDYCQSASGGSWESCDIMLPTAGKWYVILINFEEAVAGVADAVTLGTTIVPGTDAENFWVEGPASVALIEPYDLRVYWDIPTMEMGDRWYGAFSLGSEPSKAGDIGLIPVNLIRGEDDVVKDATAVKVGDDITITYQLTVQPNVSKEDYTLILTDTIPAGLTYVVGSADASLGSVNVVGNQLTWTGDLLVPTPQYLVTDNTTDPNCDTPIGGGYLDAYAEYGYTTIAGLAGDSISWQFGTLGTNTEFYGTAIAEKPRFTDDGFVLFPDENTGDDPWTNQDLPDPTAPNGLAAPYWRDMEIVYTPAPTNTGVTGVNYGVAWMVEFDDIQVWGDPSQTLDFQIWAWKVADPSLGTPDIVYAYANVNIDDTVGTIGIENADGTVATQYAYDDFTPTDGLIVCLDWYVPGEPVIITYQVTVDDPTAVAEYTNVVEHDTNVPGTVVETASHTIAIDPQPLTIVKSVSPESISNYGDTVTYTIKLTNPNVYSVAPVTMTDTLPPVLTFESWVEQPAGAILVPPRTIEWAGTIPAEGTVEFVFTASTPLNTQSILIDVINTAYMGYPGGADSSTVSFSLIRKLFLPLVMRAYTTP